MLKYLFAFIIFMHGLIHCMGFAKAFGYGNITQISKEISKPAGIVWLAAAILLVAVTVLYLSKNEIWPFVGIFAAVLSQVLISLVWHDARFGSIANMLLLVIAILSWMRNEQAT